MNGSPHWLGGLLCALALSSSVVAPARELQTEQGGAYPIDRALGARPQDAQFARAVQPRPFRFPEDHGAHPRFRTEWWYFTGNLETAAGRRFGYELTFFRIALAPDVPDSRSAWRTNQLYMAHFALTDVAAGQFHAFERFSRAALGLAGAALGPFRVWIDDWQAQALAQGMFPLRLEARQQDISIALQLDAGRKPLVPQGDRGLSRKSGEPGNASYYYSGTRLPTGGRIAIGGRDYEVSGDSWLDREWSTSALSPEQSGWDWFALQLDDGRELMFYRLRRTDGGIDPHSAGVIVDPDGQHEALHHGDVSLDAQTFWRSPATGVRYPARWELAVPARRLRLEIVPLLADQELDLTVRYWEGAVRVEGTGAGQAVSGRGYVELAGYGKP